MCRKYSIACLQETYITDDISTQWDIEWGGKFFHHQGSANSKGIIILLNNSLTLDEKPIILLSEERILAVKLFCEGSTFIIINIYAPNKKPQKINFFYKLHNFIDSLYDESNIIITGDFNSVLDNEHDIVSGLPHDKSEINVFNKLLSDFDLVDTWRISNIDKKDFTWSKPLVARRLDYLLCTLNFSSLISDVQQVFVSCSDHKAITAKINNLNFQRGPSMWQLNISLLKDTDFIDFINVAIDNFLSNETNNSPQRKWELLKAEIKSLTIQFCTQRNKLLKFKYQNNLKEINRISSLLTENPKCPSLNQTYNKLKLQQEIFDLNKVKGAQVRSRIKYIEEGEKNTKYFLSLEKARGVNNTIFELEKDVNKIVDPILIVDEIKRFYSDLYTEDDKLNDNYDGLVSFLNNSEYTVLNEDEKTLCEKEISLYELGVALKSLNDDSSAGCDGLPTPFYKVFWNKIKIIVLESFNEAIRKGELSTTQRRG